MSTWQDLKNNPRLLEIYKTRIEIVRLIREFFWSREFKEVETPIAVRYPGQEPYLNPVPVLFHDPVGKEEKFYLHTSPEFAMKKLLAVGFDKIFQICKCFRDYESFGGLHNTEFTMIEWYRSPGELADIMDDTEELFKFVALRLKKNDCHSEPQNPKGSPLGRGEESLSQYNTDRVPSLPLGMTISHNGHRMNIFGNWERKSMRELWREYVGVELNVYLEIEELRDLVKDKRYKIEDNDRYEDLFFKIFLNDIEPKLGLKQPIFVYDYPARMCSLSKLCEHDNRYAQRFELYIDGLEIANAFGELTDADEQKKRLEEDKELRQKLGKPTWDIDLEFIEALKSEYLGGLPAEASRREAKVGGVALGVDRMVLLFTGAKDINEVVFQSVGEQLENF